MAENLLEELRPIELAFADHVRTVYPLRRCGHLDIHGAPNPEHAKRWAARRTA